MAAATPNNVLETARQIVRSLATTPNAADDMLRILSAFDQRLSSIPDLFSPQSSPTNTSSATAVACGVDASPPSEAELRLAAAEKILLHWDPSNPDSLIWDSPQTASQYLSAADDVISLVNDSVENDDFLGRAESVVQVAVTRLQDEFRHLMIHNTVALDIGDFSGGPSRRASIGGFHRATMSMQSVQSVQSVQSEEISATLEEGEDMCCLVLPEVVPELKAIADRIVSAGCRQDICKVYCSLRRDILIECFGVLGIGEVSVEEVRTMEWKDLNYMMRKWASGLKLVVRVVLVDERGLCDEIFGCTDDELKEECFNEVAKFCIMFLLDFGDAVAQRYCSPEVLFRFLGMYEALLEVEPDIQNLFSDECREFICGEVEGTIQRLGEAAKATVAEFGNAVQGETSEKVMPTGEIHPLSRYVLNYLKLMAEYKSLLNKLLADGETEAHDASECDEKMSPLGRRVLLLISYLESNLEEKSKVYEDPGLNYVFLMNNGLYIVQRVKESELLILLGDQWVRKRRGQIRQLATSYLRASWTKILSHLKDESLSGSGSSSGGVSRAVLKEKCRSFNLGFEEIYKSQTVWKIPDPQLREELRISIYDKVLPAYRSFVLRFGAQLDGGWRVTKHIKYSVDDLETLLGDFFEGIPAIQLHSFRRKLSI